MQLEERLQDEMKKAMKQKEKFRLSVIRMLRSEVQNFKIEKSGEITEDELVELIAKEKKKRQENLDEYRQMEKEDMVRDLEREIEILDEFLPEQLSEEDLKEIILEEISNTGAESPQDMGKVMKAVMPRVRGRADGKKVNQLVNQLLQSSS